MSRIYMDYFRKTVITIPDNFIDVKTGDTHPVSPQIIEEMEYHSNNNTLQHLVFSALNDYFHKNTVTKGNSHDVLAELLEIKKILNQGYRNSKEVHLPSQKNVTPTRKLNIKEIEDVLEAFGG
ncbi:hypothetical protein [Halobacillus litoralis]|uniref:Uncharacterized protein n=1 Tax=Halobacillus litoralis TaxID=45668 RepID=A0A410MBT3_9BACI|nr:hypothetical protein [Halobacillus litoralis]QAS52222.1 hypothetical protein HLI_08255 [Halobacillus litoralis]